MSKVISLKKSGFFKDYYESKLYRKIEKQIIFLVLACAFIKWCQDRNINIELFLSS